VDDERMNLRRGANDDGIVTDARCRGVMRTRIVNDHCHRDT